MSWIVRGGGFELFCNRDELRTRAVALPPARSESGGVAYLAPRDGDAGGTWIAVNELGLCLSLVNRYPDPAAGPYTSRGLLVRELAGAASAAEVEGSLGRLESGGGPRYRPFTLVALAPGEPPLALAWDGGRLLPPDGPAAPPVSSSSCDPAAAEEARRRLWESRLAGRGPTAEDLLELHRSHRPERGPLSPCMHRADARTVSLTRVRVTSAAVEMAYAGGPPCRTELGPPLSLLRRTPGRARRPVAPAV